MKTRVNAIEWSCDSDTCDKTVMVPVDEEADRISDPLAPKSDDEIPSGWIIGTTQTNVTDTVVWQAHAASCIGKAIKTATDRSIAEGMS